MSYSAQQFGYYSIGDYTTFSKLEAIERSVGSFGAVDWNFNDEYFSTLDWKTEPKETLQELYRQRAQQIRDSYDYVVLLYSGGADSTNILDTFINNNIKLDETLMIWGYEGDKGNTQTWFNSEIANVAIPKTKKLLTVHPHIKHRLIDHTSIVAQMYNKLGVGTDFIYMANTCISPNNLVRFFLREHVKEYADMIAAGKRLCFVAGSEKPRISLNDGKYCFRFQDMVDSCISVVQQQKNPAGYYDELFYWSKDFGKGLVKQSHVVMNALKTAPINKVDFQQDKHAFGSTVRNGVTWYLTTDGLHKLIYPTWDINTFTTGKANSPVLSKRDTWFINSSNNPNVTAQTYLIGIKERHNKVLSIDNGFWTNNGGGIADGLKGCLSRPYFLE